MFVACGSKAHLDSKLCCGSAYNCKVTAACRNDRDVVKAAVATNRSSQPSTDRRGYPRSDGLQPSSDGLHPRSDSNR